VGSLFVDHHHHAQCNTAGIFPGFEEPSVWDDVNALDQEVNSFSSGSFHGSRYSGLNGQTRFVPVKHGLTTAPPREGRAMQGFMLLFMVRYPHNLPDGIGGHDTGEPGSLG
jgi:hypothetical protein